MYRNEGVLKKRGRYFDLWEDVDKLAIFTEGLSFFLCYQLAMSSIISLVRVRTPVSSQGCPSSPIVSISHPPWPREPPAIRSLIRRSAALWRSVSRPPAGATADTGPRWT